MNNDTILKASINIITVIEKEIIPLNLDIKLGFSFGSTNPHYQAIALERVRTLLNVIFNNSILINRENELCNKLKEMTSTPIIECWDEPWDQFIAIIIYYKLSAILEDKAFIEFINISGDSLCDDLEYTYYADMIDNELSDDDLDWLNKHRLKSVWYHRSDTSINEDNNKEELTWEMYGLPWDADKKEIKKNYVNNIRPFKPFKPKIVK